MPGKRLTELLRPEEKDYFVLKPMHSGFYSTTLELLLRHLEAKTLILSGIAGNNCVLFTANDAYMRVSSDHSVRLCCVQHGRSQRRRFETNAGGLEGGHSSVNRPGPATQPAGIFTGGRTMTDIVESMEPHSPGQNRQVRDELPFGRFTGV